LVGAPFASQPGLEFPAMQRASGFLVVRTGRGLAEIGPGNETFRWGEG
jgi:hypothetical protein